jgi:HTH-type transcriptional regulator, competence development regulator
MQRYAEVDGRRLRQLRLERALTQHDLYQITGMSEDALSRLENERRHARPSTIRRLADALGVEPRELIKREEGSNQG